MLFFVYFGFKGLLLIVAWLCCFGVGVAFRSWFVISRVSLFCLVVVLLVGFAFVFAGLLRLLICLDVVFLGGV